MSMHVVVGNGPMGRATVRALLERGERVRLVSRAPSFDTPDEIELVAADATEPGSITAALEGATTVYNCANAPYHRWSHDLPPLWRGILDAARKAGARLVIASNLYAYGRVDGTIRAGLPFAPVADKGRVRAELEREALDAHRAGELPAAIVRASDFYGPEVRESVLGERFFASALRGKRAQVYGRLDVPHSYAYLPDFAATAVAVGTADDESLFGRSWIVPHDRPVTGRELESLLARHARGARLSTMGRGMLRFGGLFVPAAREMIEMLYEFEEPFVVDASETEQRLGLRATSLGDGFDATVRWYRENVTEGGDA